MEILLTIASCVVATIIMFAISFVFAYKTVFADDTVCVKREEGKDEDISFDDICEKYLKLTNIE